MKKKAKHRGSSDDAVERIRYVLRHYWGDSQSAMARELGCSQTAIWKVVSGRANPGKRLLSLISGRAGVSLQWLSYGEGPAPPKDRSTGTLRTLPVTRVLLPGPPTEHADKLSGEEFPVAESLYRPSRCWFDVPQRTAIHEHGELRLQPHDLLLVDYDVTTNERRLDLSEEIVVAWIIPESRRDRKRRLEIGLMKHYAAEDEEAYFLETGSPLYRHSRDVRQVEANLSRRDPITGKLVHLGTRTVPAFSAEDGSLEAISEHLLASESFPIQRKDIVAVCVGMFRRL